MGPFDCLPPNHLPAISKEAFRPPVLGFRGPYGVGMGLLSFPGLGQAQWWAGLHTTEAEEQNTQFNLRLNVNVFINIP